MVLNDEKISVITRFPPSPTGFLHIGRVRTLLFNYFFTKKNNGKMVFRLEDTDKERSKKEYAEDIIENLKWLGIQYDEGPYKQSDRENIYKKYLEDLVNKGLAYISKEEAEEGKRSEVIRFKNPNKKIVFEDLIRGKIEFDTTELGDFVIAKSMQEPLYHLAVVVDDHEMHITHVIRGEDGISNTPRQILIQEAIGAKRPIYAHIPLILAKDRSKLSGRHGAVSVTEYRKNGYLPEALINYLALLGWNPGGEREIYSLEELIELFDLNKVQKGGAIFDEQKLRWFNKEHLRKIPNVQFLISNEIKKEIKEIDEKILEKIWPVVLERIEILGDIKKMVGEGELDFVYKEPDYDASKLVWKNDNKENIKEHLVKVGDIINALDESSFTQEGIKNALWQYATEKGKGNVLWPTRYALSGKDKSPDPFILAEVLGKSKTIERIKAAINKLS